MRQPEAEEHGSMARGDKSDENWAAILQTESYRGTDITGTFRIPATPPVRVQARRLMVLSRPQVVERRRKYSRYGACNAPS